MTIYYDAFTAGLVAVKVLGPAAGNPGCYDIKVTSRNNRLYPYGEVLCRHGANIVEKVGVRSGHIRIRTVDIGKLLRGT